MEKLLQVLERKLGRFAIHNISIFLLAPQVAIYVWSLLEPEGAERLYARLLLDPEAIIGGEFWRAFSYVLLPPQMNLLFFIFYVFLFHLYCGGLEAQWGRVRLNLYILFSWFFVLVGTFIADRLAPGFYHVRGAGDLAATLFLGFATLYPNYTFMLYAILPVKAKWLGWLTVLAGVYAFGVGQWDRPADYAHRVVILAGALNYLLFFGPALLRGQVQKQAETSRRRQFEEAMRRGHEERERALRAEGPDGSDPRDEERDLAPPSGDEHDRGFRRD